MSILSAQLLTALVLLLGAFFCGVLPSVFIVWRRGKYSTTTQETGINRSGSGNKVLSFLMCLGAGVLFATCCVHMLPEVLEHFEDAEKPKVGDDVLNSTMYTTLAEDVVNSSTSSPMVEDVINSTSNVSLVALEPELLEEDEEETKTISIPMLYICLGFFCVFAVEEVIHAILTKRSSKGDLANGHVHGGHFNTFNTAVNSVDTRRDSNTSLNHTDANPPNYYNTCDRLMANSAESKGPHLADMVTGILIVAALSFHSLFEGMAVGLQKTEKDIWTTGMAIAVHKFVVAFAVGLEIYSESRKVSYVMLYVTVFAVMSPLGIVIAILAGHLETSGVAINILSAMACGTLLYVVFMELLQREQHKHLNGFLQLLAVALGFGVMSGIQAATAKYDAD